MKIENRSFVLFGRKHVGEGRKISAAVRGLQVCAEHEEGLAGLGAEGDAEVHGVVKRRLGGGDAAALAWNKKS